MDTNLDDFLNNTKPIFALPSNIAYPIRELSKSIEQYLCNHWSGVYAPGSLKLILSDFVQPWKLGGYSSTRDYARRYARRNRWRAMRMDSGLSHDVTGEGDNENSKYAIEPGVAMMGGKQDGTILVVNPIPSAILDTYEHLQVVRDMMLANHSEQDKEAGKLAKEIMPAGYGIFLLMCTIERKQLKLGKIEFTT